LASVERREKLSWSSCTSGPCSMRENILEATVLREMREIVLHQQAVTLREKGGGGRETAKSVL